MEEDCIWFQRLLTMEQEEEEEEEANYLLHKNVSVKKTIKHISIGLLREH